MAIPFSLKNVGATFQRFVNKMFKDQIGHTMDVYIDDMVIKFKNVADHVKVLKETFDILRAYNMKLNPLKCNFGISSGKFLGHMVTRRGIEGSLEQIKSIMELTSPTNVNNVQRLTVRVAVLNMLILKSSYKCRLFYDVLRKNKGFQ